MAKHSAGRWTWGYHRRGSCRKIVSATGRIIAHTDGASDEDSANATLISAAPDLLAACEEAVAVMESAWKHGATPLPAALVARDRARAAVAKATHETAVTP